MALTINDSNENFSTWLGRKYIDDELKQELAGASVLILPFEDLREDTPPAFPIGTESLLEYFRKNLPMGTTVDVCINEDEFAEFAFYNNYRRLGKFLLLTVSIPVFVTVLSSYVYDNFIKEDDSKPDIIITDNSTSVINNTTIINTPQAKVTPQKTQSEVTQKKFLQDTHITFSVTLVDSLGKSKDIKYEGPAAEIGTALEALKEYEGK